MSPRAFTPEERAALLALRVRVNVEREGGPVMESRRRVFVARLLLDHGKFSEQREYGALERAS